ncbi:MAG: hypothetical protein AB1782_19915 [Cyanobacteriota bacterium]
MVLPLITEEMREAVFEEIGEDVHSWRKTMIHYIKEDNPEVNAAIIQAATITSLDAKAVATGAYMIYKMLESAAKEQNSTIEQILE